ncbi:hypothetical protein [Sphingomonas melonis]
MNRTDQNPFYSGSMLLTGYVASVAAMFLLGYFDQRGASSRMY